MCWVLTPSLSTKTAETWRVEAGIQLRPYNFSKPPNLKKIFLNFDFYYFRSAVSSCSFELPAPLELASYHETSFASTWDFSSPWPSYCNGRASPKDATSSSIPYAGPTGAILEYWLKRPPPKTHEHWFHIIPRPANSGKRWSDLWIGSPCGNMSHCHWIGPINRFCICT